MITLNQKEYQQLKQADIIKAFLSEPQSDYALIYHLGKLKTVKLKKVTRTKQGNAWDKVRIEGEFCENKLH